LRALAGIGRLRRVGRFRRCAGWTGFIRADWGAPVACGRGAEAKDADEGDHLSYFHHTFSSENTKRPCRHRHLAEASARALRQRHTYSALTYIQLPESLRYSV